MRDVKNERGYTVCLWCYRLCGNRIYYVKKSRPCCSNACLTKCEANHAKAKREVREHIDAFNKQHA